MSSRSSPKATIDRKQAENDASKGGINCDMPSLPPSCNPSSMPEVRNQGALALPFALSSPRDPCNDSNTFTTYTTAFKNSRMITIFPTPEEDENYEDDCVPTLFTPLAPPQPSPQNQYSAASATSPSRLFFPLASNEECLHLMQSQLPLPSGTTWTPELMPSLPPCDDPIFRQSILADTHPPFVPSSLSVPPWTRTIPRNIHVPHDLWSSSSVGPDVDQDKEQDEDEDKKNKEVEEDFALWSEVQQQVEFRTRRLRYENWKLQQTVWALQRQAHRQEQDEMAWFPPTSLAHLPVQQELFVPHQPAGYPSYSATTLSTTTTGWLPPPPPQEPVASFSQQEQQSQPPPQDEPPTEWRIISKNASQELEAATTPELVEKVAQKIRRRDAVLAGHQHEEECSININTATDSAANVATPDVVPKKRLTTKKTSRSASKKSSRVTTTKKKKKDLTRPKRPMTAYNFYFKQQRALMLANENNRTRKSIQVPLSSPTSQDSKPPRLGRPPPHRVISFADMARQISKQWKTIDPDLLANFERLAVRDKERYWREKEAWLKQKQEC